MGVTKVLIKAGDGSTRPKQGDVVSMEYTGWLYAADKPENKGDKFDSSVGRGELKTEIGVGSVIRGWDDGIIGSSSDPNLGMTLGEKSTLTITSDYAYGDSGFPGHIPPGATLIFDVELKAVNNKRA